MNGQKIKLSAEQERLDIARLLIKAGYTVRIGREKPEGKANGAFIYFVEFCEE